MAKFKRVSLIGSEEIFRATHDQALLETQEVIAEVIDARTVVVNGKQVSLSPDEVELLLEAIQLSKYPDKIRTKPSLEKHERLDRLRAKLQG